MKRAILIIGLVASGILAPRVIAGSRCQASVSGETHVSVQGRAFSVLPTPDGCWVFVSMDARPDGSGGGLAVIDLLRGSPKLARTVTGPSTIRKRAGMALTHDGRFLMLGALGRISVYDVQKLKSNDADPLAGEYIPNEKQAPLYFRFAITADNRTMFVSDHANEAVTVIDLAETQRSNFRKFAVIGNIPVGWGSSSVVLSRDGRRLYALTQIAADGSHWQKVCRAPGAPPTAVPNHLSGAIQVIDTAKAITDPAHSVLATIPAGCDPVRLIVDKDGRRAYVTSRSDDKVLVFDVDRLIRDPANALIASVPTRTGPVGIVLLDAGKRLAVANAVRFSGGKKDIEGVSIIDTKTIAAQPRVLGNVTSPGPVDLALMANGSILLVANYESEQVTFLKVRDLPR